MHMRSLSLLVFVAAVFAASGITACNDSTAPKAVHDTTVVVHHDTTRIVDTLKPPAPTLLANCKTMVKQMYPSQTTIGVFAGTNNIIPSSDYRVNFGLVPVDTGVTVNSCTFTVLHYISDNIATYFMTRGNPSTANTLVSEVIVQGEFKPPVPVNDTLKRLVLADSTVMQVNVVTLDDSSNYRVVADSSNISPILGVSGHYDVNTLVKCGTAATYCDVSIALARKYTAKYAGTSRIPPQGFRVFYHTKSGDYIKDSVATTELLVDAQPGGTSSTTASPNLLPISPLSVQDLHPRGKNRPTTKLVSRTRLSASEAQRQIAAFRQPAR